MLNLHRTVLRPGFARFVLLTAIGSLLAMLATVWISLCGTSPISFTALGIGVTLGAIGYDWASLILFSSAPSRTGGAENRSVRLGLFMAQLAVVWATPFLLDATLLAGCETFGTSGTARTLLALAFPAFVLALNIALGSLLFRAFHGVIQTPFASNLPPVAVGAVLMLIHGWFTVPLAATVTICFFMAAVLSELSLAEMDSRNDASDARRRSDSTLSDISVIPVDSIAGHWMSIAAVFASTLLIVAGANLIGRLIVLNLPTVLISLLMASVLIYGISLVLLRRLVSPFVALIVGLFVLAVIPNAIAVLTDWNLSITASSTGFGMLVQRSIQLSIITTAALIPLLAVAGKQSKTQSCLVILVGVIAALTWLGRGLPVGLLMTAGMMIHSIVAMLCLVRRQIPGTGRPLRHMAIVAMVVLSIMPSMKISTDTSTASSLLFSPRTIAAIQRGLSRDMIDQSDANRLVESTTTESGNISVWRRAGHVYEFQRNGSALGRVSADVRITPQPPEDVLPAIIGLVSHPRPGRILLLGDDTGACLRCSTHFPVQEILALRTSPELTELAKKFTWSSQEVPADTDSRVRIRHGSGMMAMRDRSLKSFDVIVAAMPELAGSGNAFQYTTEFYESVRQRLDSGGVFCQRMKQADIGPVPIKQVMSGLMEHFEHVGVLQTIPGELILIATNRNDGIVDSELLSRMQRDHVKQEIAGTGLDWAQVAVLPFVNADDPDGIFRAGQRPNVISIRYGGFSLCQPLESIRRTDKSNEIRLAFAPHQVQLASSIPVNDDLKEAQRRLSSLQQQIEILAGMPDQPWTYRKSLRMEMQRDPRPPVEVVRNGQIVKEAHPLDELRKEYFVTLGDALQTLADAATQTSMEVVQAQVATKVEALQKFTSASEPLMSHFAHFEIIRLHELAQLTSLDEEFRHRLHIVFFTTPTDASVRPVISALEQLVEHPELVKNDVERYDLLNALVQKLIERWEARTAWEPKSAIRVQNDVEKSVRVVNLAMDQMERATTASHVQHRDFVRRRRFVTAALIAPLREYRDQVLAHRSKMEASRGVESLAEPNTEDANDSPLLNPADSRGINTN